MIGQKCPVCGKHIFEVDNDFEFCPICGWENDAVQRDNPDSSEGANVMSLNEYKREWLEKNSVQEN